MAKLQIFSVSSILSGIYTEHTGSSAEIPLPGRGVLNTFRIKFMTLLTQAQVGMAEAACGFAVEFFAEFGGRD